MNDLVLTVLAIVCTGLAGYGLGRSRGERSKLTEYIEEQKKTNALLCELLDKHYVARVLLDELKK